MVTVLGVRHHGPGSARAVGSALDELHPDAVLIEGPPDAEAVIELAADPHMRPPVALLIYALEDPRKAAFYPFANFSPEWVAMRHALQERVELRLIDLPMANVLAADDDTERHDLLEDDPLARLASAAGYDDPERWWEDVIEHRSGSLQVFADIASAMAELRLDSPAGHRSDQREAAMRRAIRRAEKDGFERIVVVCGAWHAPALERAGFPSASRDDALLAGLAKVKVAATWIPWTNAHLARSSGYGAGVQSPGWYQHLFEAPNQPIARWMQRVAALLRGEDLDASPASVVEAVRMTSSLASIRARPMAGLNETQDAALTVLCGGDELRLALIHRRLVVGETLGEVPETTPMVPLVRDLAASQRSLRLPAAAAVTNRELDLRKDIDIARSQLLHRLRLLGVNWGTQTRTLGLGTFKEGWNLEWRPELSIALIDASRYGATVLAATDARVVERAEASEDLPELTALVEVSLLAGLTQSLPVLMRAVADRAARDVDIGRLMDAIEPLARVHRYGSVRREHSGAVGAVLDGLLARVCVGLPFASRALDDDAAIELVARIEAVGRAVSLIQNDDQRAAWRDAQRSVSDRDDVHGLVTGRLTRLLLDANELDRSEVQRRMGRELSRTADAERGAAWLEGFLAGTGLLLLHDLELLAIVDGWVAGVSGERFDDLLPVLRRAFARFQPGERRQIGEAVRGIAVTSRSAGPEAQAEFDVVRADSALLTMLELLG
jgi:Family of unknown function (DUF5682)